MLRWSALALPKSTKQVLFYSSRTFASSSSHNQKPLFDKVLIANRGEIACRVIRTCQTMGIPTVALYSVADGPHALHATMADEAYLIGHGPHPTESYLLQDQILQLAQSCDGDSIAIHPGYGFLSENADFCQKVTSTPGVTFVGPNPKAITAMGSKSKSKAIMEAAGVPTTPGFYGDDTQEPEILLAEGLKTIGFPLMIKAVMGGGGKGMRIVWKESEFFEKLQACQRESLHSFGDDRVLLEKYLHNPRHVEVQVVADSHGNVVHLYERDCSLQRRHQKIIEEAPATYLPMELRDRLGEMGKTAAQAVGYVNAGTVEFLLDSETNDFYFCEMNTRLQVEHPITELITGVDLVEWQLRIAAGEELPIKDQSNIPCQGHAFEARIYAEQPARGFLPATGTVWHHRPPATPNAGVDSATGVRVDTGIQAGQEVGVYYDPMICKLIVHDENREKALKKLVTSLKSYQIAGVPTNIDFLIQCAQHPTFQKGEGAVHTGFLDDHLDEVLPAKGSSNNNEESSSLATAVGVFSALLHLEGRIGVDHLAQERQRRSPWSSLSGSWRLGGAGGPSSRRVVQLDNGNQVECTAHRDGSYDIRVGGGGEDDNEDESFHVTGTLLSNNAMEVVVNHTHRISMTTAMKEEAGQFHVHMWPTRGTDDDDYHWQVHVENPLVPSRSSMESPEQGSVGQGTIKSPMPGKISHIHFRVGDAVQEGDVLVVMEAMKMEHSIESPVAGVVTKLGFEVGAVVPDGAILAIVEAASNTGTTDNESDQSEAV